MTHCDNTHQARVFEAAIDFKDVLKDKVLIAAQLLNLPFQEEDDNG